MKTHRRASLLLLAVVTASSAALPRRPTAVEPAAGPEGGAIESWILHFDPRLAEEALPTYRDLLAATPARARIVVAVPEPSQVGSFADGMGKARLAGRRIDYLVTARPLTAWARDRYVLFSLNGTPAALLPARDSITGDKLGDLEVAALLAETDPELRVIRSNLVLEGGDVLFAKGCVLIGLGTLLDNAARLGGDVGAATAAIEEAFGRTVFAVGEEESDLPHGHLDMFLTVVGSRTLLLGDPRLASDFLKVQFDPDAADPEARSVGIFSLQSQNEWIPGYEKLAAQLRRRGFRVERLPILHSDDGTILTWNNAVVERRSGVPTAYVPRYGIPSLDGLAFRRWEQLGFRVEPVRCTRIIAHGGAVRCLTSTRRLTTAP
ncbi:MAG: hypothetical protein ACYSX0_20780 [Planctomycetota bacterium]|jgi:N-dimethylarginine dimethylaminohydrolase